MLTRRHLLTDPLLLGGGGDAIADMLASWSTALERVLRAARERTYAQSWAGLIQASGFQPQ